MVKTNVPEELKNGTVDPLIKIVLGIIIVGLTSVSILCVGYWYGQGFSGSTKRVSLKQWTLPKNGQPERSEGDEELVNDPNYKKIMAQVPTVNPAQKTMDEINSWVPYEDTVSRFSFSYPATRVFILKPEAGSLMPYLYVDTKFILDPVNYDGAYTPVEVRTGNQITAKTVQEAVNTFKKMLAPGSFKEMDLPVSLRLKGVWVTGVCQGYPCDGEPIQSVYLMGTQGLISIDYYPTSFGGRFPQDLFDKIIASLKVD